MFHRILSPGARNAEPFCGAVASKGSHACESLRSKKRETPVPLAHLSRVKPACSGREGNCATTNDSTLFDFFNRTFHIKVCLRHLVVLAVKDFLEAANGFSHGHLFALVPGEHLRNTERLAQKTLGLPRTEHRELVLRR